MKRTATFTAALIATALCGIGPAAADGETASPGSDSPTSTALQRVAACVQPSIVYLQQDWTGYVHDTYNESYLNDDAAFTVSTQCTGYIVNPWGYIATAGHCVDPKGDIQALFTQQAAQWAVDNAYYSDTTLTTEDIVGFGDYKIVGTENRSRPDLAVTAAWGVSAGGVDTSEQKAANVVKFQPFQKGDGAVLKVDASDLPALQLADSSDLEIGTDIVAIGYPVSVDEVTDADLTPSYKEGTISAQKTIDNGLDTVYEISAAMSGGMSGGPTVDPEGHVVGFNDFTNGTETQQFNFVRTSSIISAMLADAGVENDLGEVGQAYRDGLDAYFAGDKAGALASLQSVVDQQPTNSLAQEYLTKTKALPDPVKPAEDSGGLPIIPIAGGVAALLLIGVGVLLLMKRKGSGGQHGTAVPVMGGSAGPTMSTPMATGPTAAVAPTAMTQVPPVVAQATEQPMAQAAPPPVVQAPPSPVAPLTAAPMAPAQPAVPVVPAGPAAPVGFTAPDETPAEQSVTAAAALLFCTTCGTKGAAGQAFCGKCGTGLA